VPIVLASSQPWVIKWGPRILTGGALAGLCWVLALWTWVLVAPRPPTSLRAGDQAADLTAAREQIQRSGIFGSGGAIAEPSATAPSSLDLKLVGITASASRGAGSRAVLNVGGKGNEVFREGKEIAPGIVLNRIEKDHVLIRRQGTLERLAFPEGPLAPAGQAQGFRLNVQQQGSGHYSFSGDTLTRALQDPQQLAQVGVFTITPGAGIVLNQAPAGSLAQKLSLQAGDVIRTVNGEVVNSPDDLARLYQKFTGAGQVKLEGTRAGAPLALTLTISP
jgi:general secretion pathway protein C